MPRLSVGFIGAGGIARSHTKALKTLGNTDFVAFCDIVKERALSYCQEYGGNAYTDFRKMINEEEMDAVYICLPPFAHSNEVNIAAENGIHVFIQKPIALNMDLAEEMVSAVDRAGVKSQVGYQLRFGTGIQRARELLQSADLGPVTLCLGRYLCNFLGGSWWRQLSKSGGQIVEQSTHVVDLLRYLCGDIEKVYSEMDTLYWDEVEDMEIEDVSSTTMKFESGAIGSMVATTGGYPGRWIADLKIFTKKAVFDLPDPHTLILTGNEEKEKRFGHTTDLSLAEASHFTQAILEDTDTCTPISDGAKTLEATLSIRRSGEEGRPVTLG